MRRHVVPARQRRRHDPANDAALAVDDEREHHRRHAELHDRHAQDARRQEVDVLEVAALHLLAFRREDRSGLRDRERHLVDDLIQDRLADRDLLSAALVLDVPYETLRGLVRRGLIRPVKIGRAVYFRRAELLRFAESLS